jgi:hypothetical protein
LDFLPILDAVSDVPFGLAGFLAAPRFDFRAATRDRGAKPVFFCLASTFSIAVATATIGAMPSTVRRVPCRR